MGIFSGSISIPTGSYLPFAASTPPAGFLKCDGSAISRSLYPELFAVIGTTYGAGDGSTTFNLPNFINRTFWGAATSGAIKQPALPNIGGILELGSGTGGEVYGIARNASGCFNVSGIATNTYMGGQAVDHNFKTVDLLASRSNSIYGASTTVQPPALATIICIKY